MATAGPWRTGPPATGRRWPGTTGRPLFSTQLAGRGWSAHHPESPPRLAAFLRPPYLSPCRSGHWEAGPLISLTHPLVLASTARALWVKRARFMDESEAARPLSVGFSFHRPQQIQAWPQGPSLLCSLPTLACTPITSSHALGIPIRLTSSLPSLAAQARPGVLGSEAHPRPPTLLAPANQSSNAGTTPAQLRVQPRLALPRISWSPLPEDGRCTAVYTSGASGHAERGCPRTFAVGWSTQLHSSRLVIPLVSQQSNDQNRTPHLDLSMHVSWIQTSKL